MEAEFLVILMFVGVFVAILAGFPVAFALLGMAFLVGIPAFGDALPAMLIRRVYIVANNYVLAAVPFFIFMGAMLEKSGIAGKLFEAIKVWIGNVKGGLAISTIVLCTILAAATGVIGASVVIAGLLALPAMLKYNYQKELAVGTILAGGALGTIIPPSVVTVVYGPTAGVSVGQLLMATILPGFLLSTIYIIYIFIRCQLNPKLGPPVPTEVKLNFAQKFFATIGAIAPTMILIIAVLGSIILGLAAPTEAAALGAFGAAILCFAYRRLNWLILKESVYETIRLTSMIMLVLTAGTVYTGVFLGLGTATMLENAIIALDLEPMVLLFMFLFIIILAGFLLDWISILLIFVPVFSIIIVKVGIDPVWFGVLVIMAIQTSYLTPPMAPGIFYLKGICPPEVKDYHLFRGMIPYALLQILGIIIVVLFPKIALWLPEIALGAWR